MKWYNLVRWLTSGYLTDIRRTLGAANTYLKSKLLYLV